ncbi:restriction endonuclease subunit S [Anoxybacillus sp. EFIL]|uniref:restriction endonuclease subunit S n=1 Tax=Anoxybacillus sp. EFIL TaxID=2508869 RepID=UPI00148D7B47|nr:restriction endonuclease subunit S [Anoxybacillus sp. EFIL]NNU95431.1 restriction endonuclease subunit S [Anoxybacillus sp. EFIL]
MVGEWKNCLLGEVVEYANGSSFPNEFQGKKNGKYDFYKVSDMNNPKNSVFMIEAENTVDDEAVTELKAKIHPKDTVIFPKVGAALLTNKRRILSKPSLFDNNIMGLKAKKSILPKYLYYFMYTIDFGKFVQSGAVPSINKTIVDNLSIKLPPLFEQRKIAAILSSVDEAIEKTEAIIEQTEKVKKGLMQQLFTKGIGHTKFKKTEIGEIPEEWEVKQLAEVCVVNPTYRIEKGTICSYVEMGAVNENSPHISYFGKREAGQGGGSRFKENDVLFARITPCTENGKTALVPKLESEVGLGSTEFIVLSPLKQILDPKFLYYFVKSDRVRNYAISRMTGTTGRQRVPKEVFEQELMIALPPIDEQKKIGEILYNYDKKIDHEKKRKNQLQTIKKALMQVLLTGKVRVKVDNEVMSQ